MRIARGELLARLNETSIGLSAKENIAQSNCFVFHGDRLITFNDDVMARVPSPLDFDAVVNAADLLGIIGKIPDEEIDIFPHVGELRIKGQRRSAGIVCTTTIELPYHAVPSPTKWTRCAEGLQSMLQQSARTCAKEDTQYLATCVHITPQRVEACDNDRLLRVDAPTGFPGEFLIPAVNVAAIDGLELTKCAIGDGWAFFRTASGGEIALRGSHEPYHADIDQLLIMKKPEKLTLPAQLKDMIERAEIMSVGGFDSKIDVRIGNGMMSIKSRKDGGWWREKKKIPYSGRTLDFEVNSKFLVEILARTRDVTVDDAKMKVVASPIQFVVCLSAKSDSTDDDATDAGGDD